MTAAVLSEQHIAAQLDALLEREPDLAAVAMRSPVRAAWPERVERRGRTFRLQWVDSPLAARLALRQVGQDEGLVMLTALEDSDLGDDVLARLSRGRVFSVESTRMLRDAFQARHIDSRLRGQGWIADLLLTLRPVEGYPPVPNGVLDADTAWRHVLDRAVGLRESPPDAVALLRWTVSEGGLYRLAKLAPEHNERIIAHLAAVSGAAGAAIMQAVKAGQGSMAVAIGLACGIVFSEGWAADPALSSAAVRLETFLGGHRPEPEAARAWAEAAAKVAREAPDQAHRWFAAAGDVLAAIKAQDYVHRSGVLPAGFEARIRSVAEALEEHLAAPADARRQAVNDAVAYALAHQEARTQVDRADRLKMMVRLLRWLHRCPLAATADFGSLAMSYALDGGFVDRARLALKGGDEDALLSAAYLHLLTTVRERREEENRRFAEALSHWNRSPTEETGIVVIEDVLTTVVAPLAEAGPILLLVMDGLSFPVFRELADDLDRDGWRALRVDGGTVVAAVAALPTVTEVSRASLLCGTLTVGQANVERAGFARHKGLLDASNSGSPPVIFHKGDLTDGATSLSNEVRVTLTDRRRKVVGIVYNAVDDHLAGGDQLRLRWSLDHLRLLRPILHEARNAGRRLVIVADHGHVIDEGSAMLTGDGADRWRRGSHGMDPRELVFKGGRVRVPPADEVVLPWSETVRYGSRRNGYHGGVTPQEVLVPLTAFSAGDAPEGWDFAPPAEPDWWVGEGAEDVAASAAQHPAPPPARKKKGAPPQPGLFDAIPPRRPGDGAWIDALLASETYQAQVVLVGPIRPKDDEIRVLLRTLDDRGRVAVPVLARALGYPNFRMTGFLSGASRLLNVDQSPILTQDGDTVSLDRALLRQQFSLER